LGIGQIDPTMSANGAKRLYALTDELLAIQS